MRIHCRRRSCSTARKWVGDGAGDDRVDLITFERRHQLRFTSARRALQRLLLRHLGRLKSVANPKAEEQQFSGSPGLRTYVFTGESIRWLPQPDRRHARSPDASIPGRFLHATVWRPWPLSDRPKIHPGGEGDIEQKPAGHHIKKRLQMILLRRLLINSHKNLRVAARILRIKIKH